MAKLTAPRHQHRAVWQVVLLRMAALSVVCCVSLVVAPVVRAATIPLSTSFYNAPQVSTGPAGTTISVTSPAGVDYTATLDPTKTYRLTVMGENLNGSFVMRLDEDGAQRYVAAPNGPAVYRISGVTNFGALIYRDTPGTYLVRAITLDDCSGDVCQTDSDLAQQISSDVPGLSPALQKGDTWTAAQLVLGWVAPRTVWASGQPPPIDTQSLTASEIYYDYFATGYGGVYCGGSADFLHKVLNLFSIPNFELDFGTTVDGLTHAIVVIPVSLRGGGVEYRILDPTYNMVLRLVSSDAPASIPVALELWRAGLVDRVIFDSGDLDAREVLYDPNGDGHYVEQSCASMPTPNTGCGFAEDMEILGPDLDANGFQSGRGGYLQLLGTTQLFSADQYGVPTDLQQMLATFKTAVATNDNSVHIAALPLPPVSLLPPQVSGAPVVGSTVTADPGKWSEVNPVTSISYQWSLCSPATSQCTAISDATDSTYTVRPADDGEQLAVSVVTHNQDGDSQPAQAMMPDTVTYPAPDVDAAPVLDGPPVVGATLSATAGRWSGGAVVSLVYEWYSCSAYPASCTQIPGAHSSTYTLQESDAGRRLYVVVVAVDEDARSLPVRSLPTLPVTAAPNGVRAPILRQPLGLSFRVMRGHRRAELVNRPRRTLAVRGEASITSVRRGNKRRRTVREVAFVLLPQAVQPLPLEPSGTSVFLVLTVRTSGQKPVTQHFSYSRRK